MRSSKSALVAAAAALTLVACGGGGSSGDDSTTPGTADTMKAGEQFSIEVRENNVLIDSENRMVYGITRTGELSTDPADPNLIVGASTSLPVSAEVAQDGSFKSTAVSLQMGSFLKEYFAESLKRDSAAQPSRIWSEIEDQDQSLERIYKDYLASGLDIRAYLDFYAAVDEYRVSSIDDRVELDLVQWLIASKTTQGELLKLLAAHGTDWPGFLKTLVARNDNFQALLIRWNNRDPAQSLEQFLTVYLDAAQTQSTAVPPKVVPVIAAVGEVAKLQLEVAKFAWQVIKDNQPSIDVSTQQANTNILSAHDVNFANYENALIGESPMREIVVCTRFFGKCIKDWAKVQMSLAGTYRASHYQIKGNWVPSVYLRTQKIEAATGQKVDVNAYVASVANLGTRDDVNPYMEVITEIKVSGILFKADFLSQRFSVQGKDGFKAN